VHRIRAIGQALVDASDAAHEIDALEPPKDDQDADYDRLLWLGKITDGLAVSRLRTHFRRRGGEWVPDCSWCTRSWANFLKIFPQLVAIAVVGDIRPFHLGPV
jgi:hypothetical protein